MSWFQYPARRLKGLGGGDYHRTRKGYGGTRKGDIIFEVMESRVMPRCVGKVERGTLHYTYLWKVAQGLTARPVKFGTIVPDLIGTSIGNDHYAKQQELLFALADAMHDELDGSGGRRLRHHPDGRAEHPPGRHPARRRRAAARPGVLRRHVQPHGERPARHDRGLVPHVLGKSGAAAPVRDESVVRERAAAARTSSTST